MASSDYLDQKIEEADGRKEESQLVIDDAEELDSARLDREIEDIIQSSSGAGNSSKKIKRVKFGAPQAPN